MALTDTPWGTLEPLIQACRPHRKTEHQDLRQTIEAIIWRCQNGAKWRSVPAGSGPWWKAAGAAERGAMQHSVMCVRRLADLVAAMEPPCGASVSFAA